MKNPYNQAAWKSYKTTCIYKNHVHKKWPLYSLNYICYKNIKCCKNEPKNNLFFYGIFLKCHKSIINKNEGEVFPLIFIYLFYYFIDDLPTAFSIVKAGVPA